MAKLMMVALEVDDDVTPETLHEALCKILHEGVCFDDAGLGNDWLTDVGLPVQVQPRISGR